MRHSTHARSFPLLTHALLAAVALALAPAVSAQCPTFWPGFRPSGVEGRVRALAHYDPPGSVGPGLYVGGDFTTCADGPVAHIARWDGTYWTPLGAGISGTVAALCVFDDGAGPRLFAGGSFQSAGGQQAFFVAAWDGTSWSPVGLGISGNVQALCVYDDGSGPALYAGGSFSVPGDPSGLNVAKWNGTAWSVVGIGTNSIVWALAVHDDGGGAKLFAAGGFSSAGGSPAQKVASWNGSGWSALGTGLNASAYALASYGGELWVGGDFGAAGGVPVDFAARWNGTQFAHAGDFNLRVWRFVTADIGTGERLYATGDFNMVAGVAATQIAQYDGATWSDVGGLSSSPVLYDSLCVFDDGGGPDLYVGWDSDVTGFDGTSFFRVGVDRVWQRHIAAVATWRNPADGTPAVYVIADNQFGTGGAASFAFWDGYQWNRLPDVAPYHYMRTMDVLDLGQGEELYVGGSFQDLGGVPARSIARWDGTQFSALGAGLEGYVETMCVYDDGTGPSLYAGGTFTSSGGTATPYVARFDGTNWHPLPGGPSYYVNALCVHDDGSGPKLYAGGSYFAIGGVASPPIGRWDGSQWEAVGDTAFFGTSSSRHIARLIEHDDGSGTALYATGFLHGTSAQPTGRLLRWQGGAWTEVGASSVGDFATSARALARWDDGTGGGTQLYLAGDFTNAGPRIVRWDGTAFRPVGTGVTSGTGYAVIQDMTVLPRSDGRSELVLAGSFSSASGVTSNHVARYIGCGPITSFCAGDNVDAHVTTDCPCSNFGAAGRGCAWSGNPSGAVLQTSRSIAPDTLVLQATGMPANASATVFWKGDALLSHAVPWGDGLRCIDGNLIRLGLKTNVNGAAQYPEGANAPISVRGQTPVGSGAIGYYQTSFRNAASFCTAYTYNTTNGVRVVW